MPKVFGYTSQKITYRIRCHVNHTVGQVGLVDDWVREKNKTKTATFSFWRLHKYRWYTISLMWFYHINISLYIPISCRRFMYKFMYLSIIITIIIYYNYHNYHRLHLQSWAMLKHLKGPWLEAVFRSRCLRRKKSPRAVKKQVDSKSKSSMVESCESCRICNDLRITWNSPYWLWKYISWHDRWISVLEEDFY